MQLPLGKRHQETYDAILKNPIVRNLHRRDVTAMLGAVAEVTEEGNGKLKVTRNGHTFVLHPSRDKNVTAMDELMDIRHFLQRSDIPPAQPVEAAGHVLVVLDHREARIYKTEMHGAVPQRITPFDPHGYGRNLHYVQDEANGQRKPELKSFYEAIVKTVSHATEILIFGSGTGASSAMEQLLAVLQDEHVDLAKRVVGSVALDTQHLTENQLLAKAREFYEKGAAA